MISRRSLGILVLSLLALFIGGGCDDGSPPRSPLTPSPPPPSPTFISRLTMAGPTTVGLGTTAEFTVTAHLTDGTTRDVTGEVAWNADSDILLMTSPGRFTGSRSGETSLSAAQAGLSATIGTIIVVPQGTYRLSGAVRDLGMPISGATIFVEDEALGRTTIVTPNGLYTLFGVTGQTRITVSKDGYRTVSVDQRISSHQSVNFDLVLSERRPDIAGRYTVTFTAAPECSTLPPDVRVRAYQAAVTQGGPSVMVVLDGDRFLMSGPRKHNQFTGFVGPAHANLLIAKDDDPYYHTTPSTTGVFDRLPDGTFFGVHGTVAAAVSAAEVSGVLNGTFGVYHAESPHRPITECSSTGHRLALVR